MTGGYIDPVTGKYVQTSGGFDVFNAPEASESQKGVMTPEQVKKLDSSYSATDVASRDDVLTIFKKGEL